MLKTLARHVAPEPEAWIPIESLESLPELEELLDPRFLVDSGQSRALKIDENGRGLVYVGPLEKPIETSKGPHHHRKRQSRKRTVKLRRRARLQRTLAVILLVVIAAGVLVALKSEDKVRFGSNSVSPLVPTTIPVVVEGEQKQVLSVASTLKEFQKEQNLNGMVALTRSFDRNDYLEKQSSKEIEFAYKKSGQISVDGQNIKFTGYEITVGEILETNNIDVDGDDVVTPSADSKAYGVDAISVTRISTSIRTAQQPLVFGVEKVNDPSMKQGTTKVQRKGSNGVEEVTYTQTINYQGQVVSEVVSKKTVIKQPVSQIIKVGTKKPAHESGKATFYSAGSGTCAHKTLPMGTIVTVTNTANGKSTTCRVSDRGPFAQGRIIDLSKDAFSKIGSLSTGVISVTLSW